MPEEESVFDRIIQTIMPYLYFVLAGLGLILFLIILVRCVLWLEQCGLDRRRRRKRSTTHQNGKGKQFQPRPEPPASTNETDAEPLPERDYAGPEAVVGIRSLNENDGPISLSPEPEPWPEPESGQQEVTAAVDNDKPIYAQIIRKITVSASKWPAEDQNPEEKAEADDELKPISIQMEPDIGHRPSETEPEIIIIPETEMEPQNDDDEVIIEDVDEYDEQLQKQILENMTDDIEDEEIRDRIQALLDGRSIQRPPPNHHANPPVHHCICPYCSTHNLNDNNQLQHPKSRSSTESVISNHRSGNRQQPETTALDSDQKEALDRLDEAVEELAEVEEQLGEEIGRDPADDTDAEEPEAKRTTAATNGSLVRDRRRQFENGRSSRHPRVVPSWTLPGELNNQYWRWRMIHPKPAVPPKPRSLLVERAGRTLQEPQCAVYARVIDQIKQRNQQEDG